MIICQISCPFSWEQNFQKSITKLNLSICLLLFQKFWMICNFSNLILFNRNLWVPLFLNKYLWCYEIYCYFLVFPQYTIINSNGEKQWQTDYWSECFINMLLHFDLDQKAKKRECWIFPCPTSCKNTVTMSAAISVLFPAISKWAGVLETQWPGTGWSKVSIGQMGWGGRSRSSGNIIINMCGPARYGQTGGKVSLLDRYKYIEYV